MRIQHNVTALNAYRNLRGNNLNLARNLEKLSSGYRINRAGDDAAGLAISEKMRAQISGLDSAKKNAEDGISLVQTAEGALTEVHSMLNRMVTLATQSANGTYDNEVDRANLQKEVTALKSEIDRISESANFNGINLLDGSMSNQALLRGDIKVTTPSAVTVTDLKATAGAYKATFYDGASMQHGEKITMSLNYTENGAEKVKNVSFTVKANAGVAGAGVLVAEDGTEYTLTDITAPTKTEVATAFTGEMKKDKAIASKFSFAAPDENVTMTAKEKGTGAAAVTGVSVYAYNKDGGLKNFSATAIDNVPIASTPAADAGLAYEFGAKGIVFGGANGAFTEVADINKAIFTVNGEKFLFVNNELTAEQWKAVADSGAHHVRVDTAGTNAVAADVIEMARKISDVTGLNAVAGKADAGVFTEGNTNNHLRITHSGKAVDKSLTLQIGDTPEDFNKMKVSIQSTSTKSLGINGVDISTQAGAADAMAKIKNAINSVSSVRGDLGALQNRLEHTINNLGVMHENITDAESRIRDTDMAKEMMAYAKNNILVQSSTAMLAQANQLPQSVLQLLQ